jgi:hypothetical protein
VTVSLQEGIQRTVDWMREVYKVGGPVENHVIHHLHAV